MPFEADQRPEQTSGIPETPSTRIRAWLRSDSGARSLGSLVVVTPMLVWAAALWPAVMVADSVDSWNQAAVGPITKWHMPIYTYVQRAAFALVHSPWAVTLLQCAVLAWAARRLLDVAISVGARRWLTYAFGGVVAVTPALGALPSHLIKDVPYTIAFVVVLEFVAREVVTRRRDHASEHMVRRTVLLFFGLLGLALFRQNGSLVLLFAGATGVIVSRSWRLTLMAFLGAVATSIAVVSLLYPALGVQDSSGLGAGPFRFGLQALYQAHPEDVPEEAAENLEQWATQEEYAEGFNCHWSGNPFQVRFYQPKPTDVGEIKAAWSEAAREDPLFFLGAHLCAASQAWNPIPSPEEQAYYQTLWAVVVENPQGVTSGPLSDRLGSGARSLLRFVGLTNHSDAAWNPTITQALLWRAPTWMYLLAGLLIAGAIRYGRWKSLWLLVPFAAQALSVIAMAGPHYRYMAPAWVGAVLLLPFGWMLATRGRLHQRLGGGASDSDLVAEGRVRARTSADGGQRRGAVVGVAIDEQRAGGSGLGAPDVDEGDGNRSR